MKMHVSWWAQAGIWLLIFLLLLTYSLQKQSDWPYAITYTGIGVSFYIIAVYANAAWLLPRYLFPKKYAAYLGLSALLLLVMVLIRMWLEYRLVYVALNRPHFFDGRPAHAAFATITLLLAFLFGMLLRMSLQYFELMQRQERMNGQQAATELHLLKSQVQPHFLFNTLNNIYSLAVAKSERTAEVVAKLSDIMRYFVDEAPQDRVSLQQEVYFITNYIELEKIRLRYPLLLDMTLEIEQPIPLIPPMLLIPFVENVFKHGIDKTRTDNQAEIVLTYGSNTLLFSVKNKVFDPHQGQWRGLANLTRRLELLYPNRFNMQVTCGEDCFMATLSITNP